LETWNMRKKKDAVSPVIATILMVAITVVLAAVLYVMVMGFGGNPTITPTADLVNEQDMLVLKINDNFNISDNAIYFRTEGNSTELPLTFTLLGTASSYGLVFHDAGGDGKISNGDYFTRTLGNTDEITILYKSGDTNTPIASEAF